MMMNELKEDTSKQLQDLSKEMQDINDYFSKELKIKNYKKETSRNLGNEKLN